MELYTDTAYAISKLVTQKYSTSFSSSITLFAPSIQTHIYAIYGLTRIADEIVDTYRGDDVATLLSNLEQEVYAAMRRGYSDNPIVMAFALTAKKYHITDVLIAPFFKSMQMDITPKPFTQQSYTDYIHGSAEVVGLMCLWVFVDGDKKQYESLQESASALGAAYQKINFLRDFAADYHELHRVYFPGVTFQSFDEGVKHAIITDIEADLQKAKAGLINLPPSSNRAVTLSFLYYHQLLKKLKATPAQTIKQKRIRVSGFVKLRLYIITKLGISVHA